MKTLHRPNFYCWSVFNPERNIDFHGYLWVHPEGNVAIDPLPLSPHDLRHLLEQGPLTQIILTNSDHVRAAEDLARETGALIWGPAAERAHFPIACSDWLQAGEHRHGDLQIFTLNGSKSPGELALLLEGDTLVTGDLIRAHDAGRLSLLPDAKLTDKAAALASLAELAALPGIQAVLPGDGWPIFSGGQAALQELWQRAGGGAV